MNSSPSITPPLHAMAALSAPLVLMLRAVTLLGAAPFTIAIALVAAIALARARRGAALLVWLAAFAGAGVTVGALKVLVHRVRPATAVTGFGDSRWSFPSGHAALAAVTYGLLAYFAAGACRTNRMRVLVSAGFAILVLAVAASRLVLGMHYLSDVLGGLAVGALRAGAGIVALTRIRNTRSVHGGSSQGEVGSP